MTGQLSAARAAWPSNPAKDALRRRIQARRQAGPLPDGDRTARALQLCAGRQVVAVYASLPAEPDSWALIEALAAAGTRILLPVLGREPDWAWFEGPERLEPARRGIQQPRGERLGAAALAQAEWIWIPGLAATRGGERLGTGGGWYDRALRHSAATAPVGVLLFDGELLDQVPTDPWDRRVDWVLTASDTLGVE
ncbi:MAG: 5-formyltetrahydrofolate cyclo-ligase [Actinobacteria bacterium]|nr:5-formyltetrahydrofolate cyclo-ligase [Actinomycetota bacterium]